jgi:hypothetical protein
VAAALQIWSHTYLGAITIDMGDKSIGFAIAAFVLFHLDSNSHDVGVAVECLFTVPKPLQHASYY